jgi:hypothetical protein
MDDEAMRFFGEAFEDFLKAEARSIIGRVHEQNLCGQLAFRLESRKAEFGFAPYHVDPEYDRMLFDSVKKIFRGGKLQDIRSDLVVHIQGNADNLIALEMKKVDRTNRGRQRREYDRQRLMAMTTPSEIGGHPEHVSGYVLGVFIELDPVRRAYLVEEFGAASPRARGPASSKLG